MADALDGAILVADPEPIAHAKRRLSTTKSSDAQGAFDPDTCRICRGEATPEEPLFYPCKCSGSIKYVHQDCLMEWLSHSQKKHCELCKTSFRFTKLYSPAMPKSLPVFVFARHITKYFFRNLLVWLRATLVVSIWLGWLPYFMRSVWSFLFWLSDEGLGSSPLFAGRSFNPNTALTDLALSGFGSDVCPASPLYPTTTTAVSAGTPADHILPHLVRSLYAINLSSSDPIYASVMRFLFGPAAGNTTDATIEVENPIQNISTSAAPPTILSEVGWLRNLTRFPFVNRTVISVFEGQIITVLVLVCFILIILVRDYVVQQQPEINMRAAFAANEHAHAQAPADNGGFNAEEIDALRGPTPDGSDDEWIPDDDDDDDTGEDDVGVVHREVLAEVPINSVRDEFLMRPSNGQSATAATGSTNDLARGIHDSISARPPGGGSGELTVGEYMRIYREANGDPNRIMDALVRHGAAEDRRDMWIRLTRNMMERKQQLERDRAAEAEEASSSVAGASMHPEDGSQDMDTKKEWEWHDESSDAPNKAQDDEDETEAMEDERMPPEVNEDMPWLAGVRSRRRANTDGPQRSEQSNPLDNNSWSFAAIGQPSPAQPATTSDRENADGPSSAAQDSSLPGSWDYPTPPSTAMSHSPAPHVSEAGDRAIDNTPDATPRHGAPTEDGGDGELPQATIGAVRYTEAELNAMEHNAMERNAVEHDIMQQNPPELNAMVPRWDADHHHAPRAPGGLAQRLADFMWAEVDEIDPDELVMQPLIDEHFEDVMFERDDAMDRFPDDGGDREALEAVDAANLEAEALIDDAEDLEGILELAGMRGPLAGLFQNALFCVFLVSITIFLGIFLPYNFGRIAVWLLANPIRPVRILFGLAKLLQDMALAAVGVTTWGLFCVLHTAGQLVRWTGLGSHFALLADNSWAMTKQAASRIAGTVTLDQPIISGGELRNFSAVSHGALLSVKENVGFVVSAAGKTVVFVFGGDYIAKGADTAVFLSNATEIAWEGLRNVTAVVSDPSAWVINLEPPAAEVSINPELAYWSGMDRFWAILAGYIALCVIAGLYLRRGGPISRGQAGQEVEASLIEGLNQASGVMKVILIIGIEMLVFPLYCGLLLDFALLPLFESTSFSSRLAFTVQYPLTSMFVHWFVGTGYMFHFALFVSMCRKIMRKGVLYFIRDPDDPDFHPVRDVLERNVTTQLRKILFSAFVYGALVVVCLGGVVWGLAVAVSRVLPIHYSSNEPVLEFPIDLLFYNFLMPLAVKFFRPSDGLHAMYTWWFRKCARGLRISWFLFGQREVDEEGVLALAPDSEHRAWPWWRRMFLEHREDGEVVPRKWTDLLEGGTDKPTTDIPSDEMISLNVQKANLVDSGQILPNGRFVRTPASDQVKVPKGRPVFLDVSEANTRLDGKADAPTTDIYSTDQYQLVYIPPHFRFRVFLFILSIWIFAAVTGVSITIVPLVFGRRMFKLLLPSHIRTNDIYAFSIGLYVLGSLTYFVFHARSMVSDVRDYIRGVFTTLSGQEAIDKAVAWVIAVTKFVYAYTFILLVFPLLIITLMELYVLIPLDAYMVSGNGQSGSEQAPRHTIKIIQAWTIGVLLLKLAARNITTWYPDTRLAFAVRAVLRRGWTDPDASILTRAFVVPGLILSALAIFGPFLTAKTLLDHGVSDMVAWGFEPDRTTVYRLAYPMSAMYGIAAWAGYRSVGVFGRWKVRIRDEAYLIGERLHNFGMAASPARARGAWTAGGNRM